MKSKDIKPNALDRMIAGVAPAYAARRLAGRMQFAALAGMGGYKGARKDRRQTSSWLTGNGSADADTIPDLPVLRGRSRDLARNTPIATGALNRVVTNVVGDGLKFQSSMDTRFLGLDEKTADERRRQFEREFGLWASSSNCDISGIDDFAGLQEMVFRSVLESGDIFVVPRRIKRTGQVYASQLQFYEADQVSTPHGRQEGAEIKGGNRIVDGIELDKYNRPVAGWFRSRHPGNVENRADHKWERIPFYSPTTGRKLVWHLYDRHRPGQTRGVPYLAPVIEKIKQLGDYSDAEVMAAVIGAMITVVFKSPSGNVLENIEPGATTNTTDDRDYKMEAGSVLEIDADDEVTVPNIGRPNANFDPFFQSICREIGSALEIPFELLILHFTASFSASRGAIETAWQFFRRKRTWLARNFCAPSYEFFMDEAVWLDRVQAPGYFGDLVVRKAWLGSSWIGAGKIVINPKVEAEGHVIMRDNGWETDAQITSSINGGDWDHNIEVNGRAERRRIDNGLPPTYDASKADNNDEPILGSDDETR